MIPALGGWWLSEFRASMVYKAGSNTATATEKPCLRKPGEKKVDERASVTTGQLLEASQRLSFLNAPQEEENSF